MLKQQLGILLAIFAVIQGYIWIFGLIELDTVASAFYFIMLCGQFVIGLLMKGVIYVK
jgi:hypothetical protein